jgi:urea transporter
MLLGTAFASPVCALCMCAGVVVGSLVGAFLGASMCELATGLYGYDASLSFIAVYYALCSSSRRKLLHSVAAAVAATLVHVAVGVTMAKAKLPAGTLGFVFATMVVVCCTKGTEREEDGSAPAAASLAAAEGGPDATQLQLQLFLRQMAALQDYHQQHSLPYAPPVSPSSLVEMRPPSPPQVASHQPPSARGPGVSMLQQV